MDVFVDDQKVEFACEPSETLEQVIQRLQAQSCPSGSVIVGVRCDGVHLAEDELSKAMGRPATDYGCLEVVSSRPTTLVAEALNVASEMLTDADRGREQIAELFSEGKTDEGIAALADCLTVWQQVHDAVRKSIHMLGVDPHAIQVQGQPLQAALSVPMERLAMVRDALKDRDYVLLADVLQYEFEDVILKWQSLIETVKHLATAKEDSDDATQAV